MANMPSVSSCIPRRVGRGRPRRTREDRDEEEEEEEGEEEEGKKLSASERQDVWLKQVDLENIFHLKYISFELH